MPFFKLCFFNSNLPLPLLNLTVEVFLFPFAVTDKVIFAFIVKVIVCL